MAQQLIRGRARDRSWQTSLPAAAEAAWYGEAGRCTTFLWVMAMRSRQSELGVEAMLAPEFSQLTACR